MHRPRQPYEERESTSTKWVVLFVLLSILAHIVTFLVIFFCAKHLPAPKLSAAPPEEPSISMSLEAPPAPKSPPKPKTSMFLPTTPDAEAKKTDTPIESDNTTRLKSESQKTRVVDSVVPDVTAKDRHSLDMQTTPLVQSEPTPPVATAPPTPKQDQPAKPTPPTPPKTEQAQATTPPPPDQPKATVAPKATPAPPKPPTPKIVAKPPPPQFTPDGLPVLPSINAPTMAPQTPNNPNQQQRTATARPPPSFQLDKSDIAGASGVAGDNSAAANSTALGRYKAKLYRAVGSRWYPKVDNARSLMPVGVVRVQYTVYSDGTVVTRVMEGNNLQILVSVSVNSITEAAPFDHFSDELIKEVGTSFTDDFSFSVY